MGETLGPLPIAFGPPTLVRSHANPYDHPPVPSIFRSCFPFRCRHGSISTWHNSRHGHRQAAQGKGLGQAQRKAGTAKCPDPLGLTRGASDPSNAARGGDASSWLLLFVSVESFALLALPKCWTLWVTTSDMAGDFLDKVSLPRLPPRLIILAVLLLHHCQLLSQDRRQDYLAPSRHHRELRCQP